MNAKDLVNGLLEGVVIQPGMRIKHKTATITPRDGMGRPTGPPKPSTDLVKSASTRFVIFADGFKNRRLATSTVLKTYTTMDGEELLLPPEKEVKVPNHPAGTCPCCFNIQQTRGDKMVDHGYTVPQWGQGGWRQGSCPGVGWLCFERSPDGTKDYLRGVLSFIAGQERMIRDLQSGKVTRLPRRDRYVPRGSQPKYITPNGPEEGEKSDYVLGLPPAERNRMYAYAWKSAVDAEVHQYEFRLKGAQDTANFLKNKINGWKPAPLLHPVTGAGLPFVYDESLVDRLLK